MNNPLEAPPQNNPAPTSQPETAEAIPETKEREKGQELENIFPLILLDWDSQQWYYTAKRNGPTHYLAGSDNSPDRKKAEVMRIGDEVIIRPMPEGQEELIRSRGIPNPTEGVVIPASATLGQTFPFELQWKKLSEVMEEGTIYGLDLKPL